MLNHIQVDSALESIPDELRVHILLELTDLASLRSLVRASPSYHLSYLNVGRNKVLSRLTLPQVDHRLLPEALAAVRSGRIYDNRPPYRPHEVERAAAFLGEYAQARGDNAHSNPESLLCRSVTEKLDLVQLHNAVKNLIAEYCLSIASKMPQEEQSLRLSPMEELRLYRAICRFQIYCNFFGHNPFLDAVPTGDTFAPVRHPVNQFLPSFSPWEVMEIACVWHWLTKRWASFIREVSVPKELPTIDGPDLDGNFEDADGDLGLFPSDDSLIRYGMRPPIALQMLLELTELKKIHLHLQKKIPNPTRSLK